MTADQRQRITSLYHAALERAASQRGAFLAEACQGEPDLLHQVESLLAEPSALLATQAETPPIPLEAGTVVGPYRLEAPIGEGGMGQVFRAVDTRLHRTVAIKVLSGKMSDSAHRHRFLQEARAASALNHPNIVIVHDICNHHGIDFLVMEHVSGQTLKDLIAVRPIPFENLLQIGMHVASALAAAHSAGIIHRDIKLANVMVTADQQVKVLDFGIAKMTAPEDPNSPDGTQTIGEATIAGLVMGTVAYMSPEQTRGEAVDRRSDIFSLGCVLYEASTGLRPFRGDNMLAVMHAIGTETPKAPSALRPELRLLLTS